MPSSGSTRSGQGDVAAGVLVFWLVILTRRPEGVAMLARPSVKRVLAGIAATCAFSAALVTGMPAAGAITDANQRFVDYVAEIKVPTSSPEETVQVGREVCKTMDAGQLEPARTLRGMVSTLTGKGLEKGQAVQFIRAAVATYCPQYTAIVGR
jgi:hypothetical protein